MTTVQPSRLAQVFVEMADTLVDNFDLIEFLNVLTTRAAQLSDVESAGLLLADHHDALQFMAASTEEARLLELFQVLVDEGPCHDAYHSGTPTINADLATAQPRWPRFAPHAVAAGYRSVHALPMRAHGQVIGALNLFGTEPGRLDEEGVKIIQALADVATIGILQERTVHRSEALTDQLQDALDSRIVIEQAKGVVSRSHGVGVDEAFALLRKHARARQVKLIDLASAIVADPARVPSLTDR